MKRAVVLLLALGACSKQAENMEQRGASYDVAETPMSPPGIIPTVAPGVAFNYRYAFELPDARIAAVQEAHAAACEKLGINRCRITGMRYSLGKHDHVEAMLAFKLDPALARAFGKDGIAAVTRADGKLTDSEITGEDAGATISAAGRRMAAMRSELAENERQLQQPNLSKVSRETANIRANELRAALRDTADTRDTAQASLATTPMTFRYTSSNSQTGYSQIISFRDAIGAGWDSFAALVSFVTLILLVLGPWVLVGGALIWLLRRVHRRWFAKKATD